jgi:hypothetical protein
MELLTNKGRKAEPAPPELFKWAFETMFKKTDELQSRVTSMKAELGLQRPYVAIHIRLGGSWTDPTRHSMKDLPEFDSCAIRLQENMMKMAPGQPRPPIVVLSDRDEARKDLTARNPDMVAPSTEIVHLDKSRPERASFIQAWAEFFVLADSSCLVVSQSGFSHAPQALTLAKNRSRCWAKFDDCSQQTIENHIAGINPLSF